LEVTSGPSTIGRDGTTEQIMNKYRTIVLAYSTLDGITQDPDGRDGTPNGGWLFHHGPEVVSGDKFGLGPILKTGVTVYGRRTWQAFSQFWPGRSDDFSMALNRMPKLVVTRTLTDLSAWTNSSRLEGDVLDAIERQTAEREVVVIGSASVVHALARQDRVDEYRISILPTVLGSGTRLFEAGMAPRSFRLAAVEQKGAAVLLRYERVTATT
jgi:dihydrofolate reductase